MLILAIDTSGNDGYVALFKGEALIDSKSVPPQTQTCLLLERLDLLLRDHSLSLDDFSIFAVCTGPGSFTGTRIGVMTAKTLAYAKKKPIIGYSAFIGRNKPFVPIGKSKGAFLKQGGQIEYSSFDPTQKSDELPLDMSAIGSYILEMAGENEEKLEIAYPEI